MAARPRTSAPRAVTVRSTLRLDRSTIAALAVGTVILAGTLLVRGAPPPGPARRPSSG